FAASADQKCESESRSRALRRRPLCCMFLSGAPDHLENHAFSRHLLSQESQQVNDMTADTKVPETKSFEAVVSRLLYMMVHSVYSDREVFLRELISNAADACERLRYEAISRPEL